MASPQGRLAPLAGAAARKGDACGHDRLRPARKGDNRPRAHPLAARRLQRRPIARRSQGATARGQPYRQQGWRRRPQGWLPTGKGSRRLRRGSGDADGAREVRASF
ncbi:hypothetical protein GW17_00046273 [Ensete ventricosum]|nr:hypothetical protein GW17_00046273 [Ensete ventricosum]